MSHYVNGKRSPSSRLLLPESWIALLSWISLETAKCLPPQTMCDSTSLELSHHWRQALGLPSLLENLWEKPRRFTASKEKFFWKNLPFFLFSDYELWFARYFTRHLHNEVIKATGPQKTDHSKEWKVICPKQKVETNWLSPNSKFFNLKLFSILFRSQTFDVTVRALCWNYFSYD